MTSCCSRHDLFVDTEVPCALSKACPDNCQALVDFGVASHFLLLADAGTVVSTTSMDYCTGR